jgi:transposase-like protein
MKFSKEEKAMWLADWRGSGKSAHSYAKENGLIPWTFHKWVKEENEKESGFVEVKAEDLPSAQSEVLIEKGDLKIHIPLGFAPEGLRMILERFRWAQ